MKKFNEMYVIGIDHGYGNMKTANCCFPTGVMKTDTEPTFVGDLLVWNKKYYSIGVGHKEFTADKFNTHRMLRLRPRAKKRGNSLLLRKEKIGKYYNNFLELLKNDPSLTYVEMDTLIGKIRDSKCILSLHIPKIKFQFYFLLNGKDSSDVTNKLNEILNIIGIDNYKKIF